MNALAARVFAVGPSHGGQVIVSGKTREAVRKPLPAGIRLRSLGRHRLRGLEESHTLFQVHADGLELEFPPLRVSAPMEPPGPTQMDRRP